jgi:hypothetical protein
MKQLVGSPKHYQIESPYIARLNKKAAARKERRDASVGKMESIGKSIKGN